MKFPSVRISYFAVGYSSPLHGCYCRGFCCTFLSWKNPSLKKFSGKSHLPCEQR